MVEFKSIPMYQIRGTERRAENIFRQEFCPDFFCAGSLSVRTEFVLSHTNPGSTIRAVARAEADISCGSLDATTATASRTVTTGSRCQAPLRHVKTLGHRVLDPWTATVSGPPPTRRTKRDGNTDRTDQISCLFTTFFDAHAKN